MQPSPEIMKILGRFLGENEKEWNISNFIDLETDETKIRTALAIKQSSIENFLLISEIYENVSPTLSDLCSDIVKKDYETLQILVNCSKVFAKKNYDALTNSTLPQSALEYIFEENPSMQKEIIKRCLNFKKSCKSTFKAMGQSSKDKNLQEVFFQCVNVESVHIEALNFFLKNLHDLMGIPEFYFKSFERLKNAIQ